MKKIITTSTKMFNKHRAANYFVGMLPIGVLARIFEYLMRTDSENEVQRKKKKQHISDITNALEEKEKLFFWTMVVCVYGQLSPKFDGTDWYIELPETELELAKFAHLVKIDDGQHRLAALLANKKLLAEIGEEFPVVVFFMDNPPPC